MIRVLIISSAWFFWYMDCCAKTMKPVRPENQTILVSRLLHAEPYTAVSRTAYILKRTNISSYVLKQVSLLDSIQFKINNATAEGYLQGNTNALTALETRLEALTTQSSLINYWIAYLNYCKNLVFMKDEDYASAELANSKAIVLLEANVSENVEDIALLALLKGLSFAFCEPRDAPRLFMEMEKLLKKGFDLDKNNVRIHFAQGSIDFHTPMEYGGGQKAIGFLTNAIDLADSNIYNPQLPTWGKEEAYNLIINYYLQAENKTKAKTYYVKALEQFPTSYLILLHRPSFD